ncbi:MAG: CRTAC1 family protein [Verrucomicrobia bacterium]|nr:CRTAC1 family protein [Verrucomicrobiota bacterium]
MSNSSNVPRLPKSFPAAPEFQTILCSSLLGVLAFAGSGCGKTEVSLPSTPSAALPIAKPQLAWLEDATEAVGVNFLHDVGTVGTYFMPESLGSGTAIFDFDNDGRMDLFLLQNGGTNSPAKHQLFHQENNGAFRDVSDGSGLNLPGRGMAVAVGDVDNDGKPDVFITEYDRVRLFHNRGEGKFAEITREAGLDNPHWGMSSAFLDYDRDGWLDLIVVNYVDYSPSMKCPDAQGKQGYCGPSGFPGTIPRLFRNLPNQADSIRFEDVTLSAGLGKLAGPGLGVVCGDANGDRWPDLLIANDGHVNWLLINQRNGTFTEEAGIRGIAYNEMGAVQANMGIAMGDADGDNLFDIFVTHLSTETHALWKHGPRGYFQDRTSLSRVAASAWRGTGFGTVFSDVNNDGAPDLLVVNGGIKRLTIDSAPNGKANSDPFWNGYEQRSQIFVNDGKGTFADVSDSNLAFSGTAAVARGLAAGDLNNDGGLDFVVTRIAASARVYRNVAPRGHWLIVRVVEPKFGARDAYGAEVTINAGGRRQTVWVNPSQSYLCSNDPRAHFGLGAATQVEDIQVIWPDGSEEKFPGVTADQIITLRKGSGQTVGFAVNSGAGQ